MVNFRFLKLTFPPKVGETPKIDIYSGVNTNIHKYILKKTLKRQLLDILECYLNNYLQTTFKYNTLEYNFPEPNIKETLFIFVVSCIFTCTYSFNQSLFFHLF
jgi:hypothetical protein